MKVYARYSDKEFQVEKLWTGRYLITYADGSQKEYHKSYLKNYYSPEPMVPPEQVVWHLGCEASYKVLDNGRYQLTFVTGQVMTLSPSVFMTTCRLPKFPYGIHYQNITWGF